MIRLILCTCFLTGLFSAFSQAEYYRVTLQPGFDYVHRFNSSNDIPVATMERNYTGIGLSATVFLTKHIGLNLKGSVASAITTGKDVGQPRESLEAYYSPDFYLEEIVRPNEQLPVSAHFLAAGGVYRLVKKRWNYQFGLNVGAMNYAPSGVEYFLKEHGTNNYYAARMYTKMEKRWSFVVEPSVLVSFVLKNRLAVFVAASYRLSPGKIRQREYMMNMYSGEVVNNEYASNGLFQMIAFNVGFSIGIGKIID
ncbi:MAG: hypothetical protein KF704_08785 [Crocinitomicaceae bacterium]|nr:hypothetical protein [Crocinitomicaceae bacterium]NGF74439.1 hypothetical protein [Fluviicola sp. SGL-29]